MRQDSYLPIDPYIELESRIIDEGGCFSEYSLIRKYTFYLERFRIDQGRRLPGIQCKGISFFKENGKLSPFRPDPKPFFPSIGIYMIHDLPGSQQFPVDPTITTPLGTRGATGHYPSLQSSGNGNFRFSR